jgi:nucleoside triphosphate diphosphatase
MNSDSKQVEVRESSKETDTDAHHFPGPGTLDRALSLVRFLRKECPWDAEQTAESLIPYLLEETHEVVDAIRDGNPEALEGELGDLLLNLAFQIVVAEEHDALDAVSVYRHLERKMIARHPHIFGGGVRRSWADLKAEERKATQSAGDLAAPGALGAQGVPGASGTLSGLARGLDPLTKSFRMQERVAAVGFDWDDHHGPMGKVQEELVEVSDAIDEGDDDHVTEEIGDLLFAAVNLARMAGVHPTTALARANDKFQMRFERVEHLAAERGVTMTSAGLAALDEIWNEVKREEG